MKTVDTNALVEACIHIMEQPHMFKKTTYMHAALSSLPSVIREVKPVYVVINDTRINIALIGGVDHRGWLFERSDEQHWSLLAYDEYNTRVWVSNIVVTLPPHDENGRRDGI